MCASGGGCIDSHEHTITHQPHCRPTSTPSATRVDAKLAAGGVCFGAGWGIGGICPGPAVVALASGVNPLPVATWLAAMVAGIAVDKRLLRKAIPALA